MVPVSKSRDMGVFVDLDFKKSFCIHSEVMQSKNYSRISELPLLRFGHSKCACPLALDGLTP